jgi:hypothetical protein
MVGGVHVPDLIFLFAHLQIQVIGFSEQGIPKPLKTRRCNTK